MSRTRILELAGGCNFRDCGGYRAADGRSLRWGRLYRSGTLSHLTTEAVESVRGLGVRAVCDLRRNDERAQHPSPMFGERVRTFEWDTSVESSPLRSARFARSETTTDAHQSMLDMYRRLPYVLQPRLAGVFEALRHASPGACIVHCTAGKDRTGIAVALVLTALDVPRDTILEDYVLTNEAVDLERQLLSQGRDEGLGLAPSAAAIQALSPVARDAVLHAHPEYVLASLEAVEASHGSIDRFLQAELGLDEDRRRRLRDDLLE
jgi:protein-tyrosine phosphatase